MPRIPARRICVVRTSALGDVVHALAMVNGLRAGYPEAHIAWVLHPLGHEVVNDNDCLGANLAKQPTIAQTHSDGFDTGTTIDVPVVVAGERPRVKVTPGGAAVVGTLWIYVKQ